MQEDKYFRLTCLVSNPIFFCVLDKAILRSLLDLGILSSLYLLEIQKNLEFTCSQFFLNHMYKMFCFVQGVISCCQNLDSQNLYKTVKKTIFGTYKTQKMITILRLDKIKLCYKLRNWINNFYFKTYNFHSKKYFARINEKMISKNYKNSMNSSPKI